MLRNRLIFGLSLLLLLVSVGQWATLRYSLSKVALNQMELHLYHDGDALLGAVSLNDREELEINEVAVEEVYRQRFSGHYYQIFLDGRLALASASLGGRQLPVDIATPATTLTEFSMDGESHEILMLTKHYSLRGHLVGIAIGEEVRDVNRQIDEQSIMSLGLMLPLLLLAVGVQYAAIRREFRWVDVVHDAMHNIRRGVLRQIDVNAPGEIRPMINEINRLLELVHRRLEQSRNALGNLAHGFKTPLAVLLRRVDDPAVPEPLQRELKTQISFIHERVERELKRARLAGNDRVGTSCNVKAELRALAEALAAVYREKGLKFTIRSPEQPVAYDREDLLELVGNLADNACKWAKQQVMVEIGEIGEAGIRIRVADDGPGCSPECIAQLGQRGKRLDEATQGHGLGLAICQDIVDHYGGELKMGCAPDLGGFQVVAELPGPQSAARSRK